MVSQQLRNSEINIKQKAEILRDLILSNSRCSSQPCCVCVCVSQKCVITHAKSSYIRQERLVGGSSVRAKRAAPARAAMCLLWIFTSATFCGQTSPFSPVCPYASEHGSRGEVGAFPCLLASSSCLLLNPIFLVNVKQLIFTFGSWEMKSRVLAKLMKKSQETDTLLFCTLG